MQSFVALYVHIVFATKDRWAWIRPEIEPRLYSYFGKVLEARGGRSICAGGAPDHVHELASLGRQWSVCEAVREMKSKSSGWIHREFPRMKKFAWQGGYAAFSVSQSNLDHVRRYIESQKEHHRRRTFKDEIRALLEAHGIDFDEAHFMD